MHAKLICLMEREEPEKFRENSHHCKFPSGSDRTCYVPGTERSKLDVLMDGKVVLCSPAAWNLLAHRTAITQVASRGRQVPRPGQAE